VRRSIFILSAALALAAPGCSGREPSDEEQVRDLMAEFARSVEAKDYATLCGELLDPALLEDIRQIGLPCEVALQQGLGEVENPKLTVGKVTVKGRTATAETRTSASGQEPSQDLVELSKATGEWRISDLAAQDAPEGSATPSPAPADPPASEETPAPSRTPSPTPTVPAPPTPAPTP
jgi:hypothetical protein